MRLRFGKRVLTGIAGLLILVLGLCVLAFGVGLLVPQVDLGQVAALLLLWQRIVLVAVALLLCALGIGQLGILFHRRDEKGFVMQHTDLGDMSISINALNSMVFKCIDQHKELTVKSTRIYRAKDGIEIDIRIILESGVNIPLTVSALQKQIKQYITSCSGVDVSTVRVLVETSAEKADAAKAARNEAVQAAVAAQAEKVQPPVVIPEPEAAPIVEDETPAQTVSVPETSPAESEAAFTGEQAFQPDTAENEAMPDTGAERNAEADAVEPEAAQVPGQEEQDSQESDSKEAWE